MISGNFWDLLIEMMLIIIVSSDAIYITRLIKSRDRYKTLCISAKKIIEKCTQIPLTNAQKQDKIQ